MSVRTGVFVPAIAIAGLSASSPAHASELATPVDTRMGQGLELTSDLPDDHAVTCADDEQLFGIDVSKWQGEIDWAAVEAAGVHYAIIRTTHGLDIIDEWFDYNWEQAHAHGIVAGVYQYFEPAQDPIAQAEVMLEMMGELQPGDLPPVIDVESATNSTPAQTAAAVGAWISYVEAATGVAPIIYTGRYFWQDNVQSDAFVDYPLWIAHYTADCPNIPAPWTTWAFHQYSSSGSVPGIAGPVDTNHFNGSYEDLLALTVQPIGLEGGVDGASCDAVRGWAFGAGREPAQVLVSFDGTADDPGALVLSTTASLDHATACNDSGCAHGWQVEIPWSLRDGQSHEVHVATGDGAPLGDPSEVGCAADLDGMRLRPIDAAGVAAWGFDPALDVLALAGIDAGDDEPFPAAPLLVRADAVAGIWWIDAGQRRAVEPDAAAAWGLGLDDAMTWPDASVQDVPIGAGLPAWRRAVEIDGTRYVVDVPAAAGPGGGDDSGSGGDAGDSADGGGAPHGDGGTTGDPEGAGSEGDDSGCRIGGDPGSAAGWHGLWLSFGGWLLRRSGTRRSRA